jgi:hypothetical protein
VPFCRLVVLEILFWERDPVPEGSVEVVLHAATNRSGVKIDARVSIFFKDVAPLPCVLKGKLTDKEARI